MSVQTITAHKPNLVRLSLVDEKQLSLASSLLKTSDIIINNCDKSDNTDDSLMQDGCLITHFIDGRGLSCPQPLLKTKVGLRTLTYPSCLYMVATDANSVQDLQAFAKKQSLALQLWNDNNLHHFLISHNKTE